MVLLFCTIFCLLFLSVRMEWVDLTDEQLKAWYTPADLCVLESAYRQGYPQKVRSETCKQFSGGSGKMHCGVGMGANLMPCFTPFIARKSFKRGWKGYTDASEKPLTEAFTNFAKRDVTVVLLGDSTTRQKIMAMECEFKRENENHKFTGNVYGILPCHSKYTVQLDGSAIVTHIHVMAIGPSSVDCLKGGLGHNDPEGGGVIENARSVIDKLIAEKKHVLILANMGLWYNSVTPYKRDMESLLKWLTRLSKETRVETVVAFHETMRQHWPNQEGSGYYHKQYADAQEETWTNGVVDWKTINLLDWQIPLCCSAVTNTSRGTDWRNDVANDLLQSSQFKSSGIHLLPFADITKDVGDMHVCHQDHKHDCTHYCYWPLLWQPLWHQMGWLSSKFNRQQLAN